LRTTDITSGAIDWTDVPFCSEIPDRLEKYQLETNDILISRAGSIGASILVRDVPAEAVFASYLIRFKPIPPIEPRFVAYFLKSPDYWSVVAEKAAGIALPNINARKLESIEMPIAPVREQQRIVEEIEKQFTRLDAGVAALKRVEANLKRYKAAVLKAAVEGRLTEKWRAEHPDVEPASELLKRILKERRRRWEEAELAKMLAKGKPPTDDRWKKKYKEPTAPDANALPPLPGGWCWATTDQLAEIVGGITKGQQRSRHEKTRPVPYLRVANVQRGYLDLQEMKDIEATDAEIAELRLVEGDILFTEGGDRDKLGRGWVWEGQVRECIHQNHIFRARFIEPRMQPKLVSWWGNTFGQEWFKQAGKQTVNLASINMTILRRFPVPLPPMGEQQAIVTEVEERLSSLVAAEEAVTTGVRRASRLRQSILKRAFEGKLVPQDPTDEPAGVLLDRIRAERTAAEPRRPGRHAQRKTVRRRKMAKSGLTKA
jgi:type I restriction enzyme S subunit